MFGCSVLVFGSTLGGSVLVFDSTVAPSLELWGESLLGARGAPDSFQTFDSSTRGVSLSVGVRLSSVCLLAIAPVTVSVFSSVLGISMSK